MADRRHDPDTAHVRRTVRRVATRLAGHPAVQLVDSGLQPGSRVVCIRVHLRSTTATDAMPDLPDVVDGIPVIALRGDYKLHRDG